MSASAATACETRLGAASIRDTHLDGQRAIVTGANSGIGEGVARGLAEAGAAVVVNYVSGAERAEQVAADIRAAGDRAMAVQGDVSQEHEVQSTFRRAIDEFGSIDILVNNAGLQQDAPFDEMTLAQWRNALRRWRHDCIRSFAEAVESGGSRGRVARFPDGGAIAA